MADLNDANPPEQGSSESAGGEAVEEKSHMRAGVEDVSSALELDDMDDLFEKPEEGIRRSIVIECVRHVDRS